MRRILYGTLEGVSPDTSAQVLQELADASIHGCNVLHVVVEQRADSGVRQLLVVLDRTAPLRAVSRYDLGDGVWLHVTGLTALAPVPDGRTWDCFARRAPLAAFARTPAVN